ncbi:exopolysaccharide biosynthesis polyprenyl glycosylphosphotransferase [Riemerella anatipestifer]|uniref:exopolysaccharide biosynthesis polyprenyl glycosylphosphotransferase n=1 Tax=Riemerella anatipestifer TaxID=34085 RepID=UPI0021098C9B|nr:exopolysaccharide biosynthesis polyprenyl glycosylphosphotransferase [Riemerella anatipestifer]MCQ4180276.1 exopolysaccharide biosynthesis polyprenyl glycosylphosphotransferase [Riemerella anatipestifer]
MQNIHYSRYLKFLFIGADIFAILTCFYILFPNKEGEWLWKTENLIFLFIVCVFWGLLSGYTRLYHVPRTLTYTLHLERILKHALFFFLGIWMLELLSTKVNFSQNELTFWGYFLILILSFKSFTFFLLKYYRSLGKNHRNVMFFSDDNLSTILKQTLLERKDYGYKVYSFNGNVTEQELTLFWKTNGIDTLFLSSENEASQIKEILKLAEIHKVNVNLVPNTFNQSFFNYHLQYFGVSPVLIPERYPLSFVSNQIIKRLFDILFSSLVLVFVGIWLFPIISFFIWLESGSPISFIQKRYGYREKVFQCFKFRTMVDDHQSCEKRVTKVGRFLRKTSLDEMPQFVNVLFGEMSVVGPRPHMLSVDDFYKYQIEQYSTRSLVKPGITGLAQVNGLRGDGGENLDEKMKKRLLADVFYIKNWSISLDIVIILKTIFLIIRGDENAQ